MIYLANNTQVKQINSRDVRFVTDNQEDNPCHLFFSDNSVSRSGNVISFPGMTGAATTFIDSKTGVSAVLPAISGYWVSDIFRCGWTYGHQQTFAAGGTYTLNRDHASTLGRMDRWRLNTTVGTFTIQMGTVDSNGNVGSFKDILAFGQASIPANSNTGSVSAASPAFPENAGVTKTDTVSASQGYYLGHAVTIYCQAFSWPATNSTTTGVIGGGYNVSSRGMSFQMTTSSLDSNGIIVGTYNANETAAGTNMLSGIQGLCNECICRFVLNINAPSTDFTVRGKYVSKASYANSKGYAATASFDRNISSQTKSIVQTS